MKKHSLDQVTEALRYLTKRGWPMWAIYQTAKETGFTVVEIANKIRVAVE